VSPCSSVSTRGGSGAAGDSAGDDVAGEDVAGEDVAGEDVTGGSAVGCAGVVDVAGGDAVAVPGGGLVVTSLEADDRSAAVAESDGVSQPDSRPMPTTAASSTGTPRGDGPSRNCT
jgi:hypothetical protein